MSIEFVGLLLAVAAGSMLVGAGLGYLTARDDERRERRGRRSTDAG